MRMTVTGREGSGMEALLMASDFNTSGSVSGHPNEDSSGESGGERLDSDVEGAIYAQLYFQDGERKDHSVSSSAGINISVVPLTRSEHKEKVVRTPEKTRQHKKSPRHLHKKPRLNSLVTAEEGAGKPSPGSPPPPHSLGETEDVDSRSLAVLKRPLSLEKVTSDTHPEGTAKGLCEWVEARWSGDSSSEEEEEEGGARDSDCVIVEPRRKHCAPAQLRAVRGNQSSDDCVIVEVERSCKQRRKSSPEGADMHNQADGEQTLDLGEGKGNFTITLSSDEGKPDDSDVDASSDEEDDDSPVSEDPGNIAGPLLDCADVSEVATPQGDSDSGQQHKGNQSCGDDSLTKDIWYINLKDKMGRVAYDRRNGTGRYFYGTKICGNCRQKDHDTHECAQPKRNKVCYLCSGLHHMSSRCPDDLCQYCLEPRHRGKSCRAPWASPATNCNRCYMNGHIAAVCPEIWRQFHNTTDYGPLVTIKPREQRQKKVFCYNCGAKGHFGHECCHKKPQGYALPFTPIIAHYDKNPHRGKITAAKATRRSPLPPEEVAEMVEVVQSGEHSEVERDEVMDATRPRKKDKQKRGKQKEAIASTPPRKATKHKVKFAAQKHYPSKKKFKPSSPPPPPVSGKVGSTAQASAVSSFPGSSRQPSRRMSLPASTPEACRPQWSGYSTHVENRTLPLGSRDSTYGSEDLRRQSSAEGGDFPRVPFLPSRSLSSGEQYYADTPCDEWRSRPLDHSATPGPSRSHQQGATPNLSFLRHQRGQDATPRPSPGTSGSPGFSVVDGQYYSSRGFRGSERAVRKITILKPDMQGRRRSHQ